MSEFLAEARILVRPDTTRFRTQLQEEVNRAVSQVRITPIQVPLAIGAGQGLAASAAATSALSAAQLTAAGSTEKLTGLAAVENTTFARQATVIESATVATNQKAGADATAAAATRSHAAAQSQLSKGALASLASFTGLRGAVLAAGTGFLAATIGVQAFGKAVASAAELENELNVFRVTSGATADEMARVAEEARKLGSDISLPAVSAGDAAQAMTELAKAGLSVQDSLAGARGVLQLATAAQIDNVQATELVAGNLNAFALAGRDAVRVADLLTGAANESQGSIADMGIALRQSAGAASQIGLSIQDTVTLLTSLARAGLAGSDAGTTLRVALLRLVAPTKEANDALERLGINLRDASGDVRVEALFELEDALRGVQKAEADRIRVAIFGQNAFRVSALLGRQSTEAFEELRTAVTEQGLAAELAGARTQGLTGDIEGMKNEAAAAGITLGQLASPIISSLAGGVTQAFRGVNLLTEGVRKLVDPPREAASSINDLNQRLREAQDDLENFRKTGGDDEGMLLLLEQRVQDASAAFGDLGFSALEAGRGLSGFDVVAQGVTSTIDGLIEALSHVSVRAQQATPDDLGLNVQQVLNRVTGFDAAEVRARTREDTAELLSVLQSEQEFLEQQLQRQAVKNRPALKRDLEQALFGVVQDLASISKEGAVSAQQAADDAAKAMRETDQAILDTLSSRRDDAGRKAAAAANTEGLRDDIRAQDRIQALIKIQIAKVRAQVKDEKTRKDAIRELRIALIASRREEKALRKEREQEKAANRQTSLELDISFAETTENVAREIQARLRLIALLKKQQDAVKKGSNEWKRLRNEIAEQQAAIKEARQQQDEAQKESKTFAQSAFEFAQTLQGFSANLLGNLIPGFATGGLVGNTAAAGPAAGQPFDVGAGVRQQGALQTGLGATVKPVQVDRTNQLLQQIVNLLQGRHSKGDPPEIIFNRGAGSSSFDTL